MSKHLRSGTRILSLPHTVAFFLSSQKPLLILLKRLCCFPSVVPTPEITRGVDVDIASRVLLFSKSWEHFALKYNHICAALTCDLIVKE